MNIPQIRMQSQFARIGMEGQRAELMIEQPAAELSIEQVPAKLNIETKKGQLLIDQSEAFAQANLMSPRQLVENQAAQGLQAIQEGAARRAAEGQALMKIENKGQPIVEQAKDKGFVQEKTISLKYIPSPFSVKIDYIPAELHIDFITEKPIIDAQIQSPVIDAVRGSVNIYMEQYESLEIDFVNLFTTSI